MIEGQGIEEHSGQRFVIKSLQDIVNLSRRAKKTGEIFELRVIIEY